MLYVLTIKIWQKDRLSKTILYWLGNIFPVVLFCVKRIYYKLWAMQTSKV